MVDKAGNESAKSNAFTFVYDKTSPGAPLFVESISENVPYYNSESLIGNLTVRAEINCDLSCFLDDVEIASELGTNYSKSIYSADPTRIEKYTYEIDPSILSNSDGTHKYSIKFRVTDNANNAGNLSLPYQFYYDTLVPSAPTIKDTQLLFMGNTNSKDSLPSDLVIIGENHANLMAYHDIVNDSTNSTTINVINFNDSGELSYHIDLGNLAEGTHSFYFDQTDRALNKSEQSTKYSFTYDITVTDPTIIGGITSDNNPIPSARSR